MIVVADASPLIFLGKIRRLDLIRELLGADIRVPRSVVTELLAPTVAASEAGRLRLFLAACRIETIRRPERFASAMSRADSEVLTLALRRRADYLLCDEHTTRAMAEAEGLRPMGTLGLLLRAVRAKCLSPAEARRLVDELVGAHGFRISIRLYQSVLAELEAGASA